MIKIVFLLFSIFGLLFLLLGTFRIINKYFVDGIHEVDNGDQIILKAISIVAYITIEVLFIVKIMGQ